MMFFEREDGQRGRSIETRVVRMADHHRVKLGGEGSERCELFGLELFAGAIDDRELFVRIDGRLRVSGEMLAAAEDARLAHGAIESPGVVDDLVGVGPVTTAAQRVVEIAVVADVEHRPDPAPLRIQP